MRIYVHMLAGEAKAHKSQLKKAAKGKICRDVFSVIALFSLPYLVK